MRTILLFFLLIPVFGFTQTDSSSTPRFDSVSNPEIVFIDPTGTYHIGPAWQENAEEPAGNQGDIRIHYLGNNKIAVCLFYVSYGPGYNVGYIFDTLIYADNWAEHRTWIDESCIVRFAFSEKGVNVKVTSDNPGFACEFGHNVYPSGYYRKISDDVPAINEDCSGQD